MDQIESCNFLIRIFKYARASNPLHVLKDRAKTMYFYYCFKDF